MKSEFCRRSIVLGKTGERTKSPDLKEHYQYTADKAQAAFDNHPLSQNYIDN